MAASSGACIASVSIEKAQAITMIGASAMAMMLVIPTCKRPRHMPLTPGGTRAIVARGYGKWVALIDMTTCRSAGKLPLGDRPEFPEISADGSKL